MQRSAVCEDNVLPGSPPATPPAYCSLCNGATDIWQIPYALLTFVPHVTHNFVSILEIVAEKMSVWRFLHSDNLLMTANFLLGSFWQYASYLRALWLKSSPPPITHPQISSASCSKTNIKAVAEDRANLALCHRKLISLLSHSQANRQIKELGLNF